MIIVLGMIVLMIIITILAWSYDEDAGICTLITELIAGSFLVVAILGCSYSTYLDQRAFYDATVNQYRNSITLYKGHAVIDVESAALTDFKYGGYQENIGKMVIDLRGKVANYNEGIIKKRKMESNIILNWLVIAPDEDMRLLTLGE